MRTLLKGNLHDTVRVSTIFDLIFWLYNTDPDAAERYAREALLLSRRINYKLGIAKGYRALSGTMVARGRYEEGARLNDSAMAIFQAINDREGIGRVLLSRGLIQQDAGNSVVALKYFIEATALFEEALAYRHLGTCLNCIGEIYQDLRQWGKALEYFTRGLALAQQYNPSLVCASLNNIGQVYYQQGQIDKALEYYEQALKAAEKEEQLSFLAGVLGDIASIKQEQGKHSEALALMKKALDAAETSKQRVTIAEILTKFTTIYRKNGHNTEVVRFARRALDSATKYELKRLISVAAEDLALAYHALGKDVEAFEAYQLFVRYKDLLSTGEAAQKLAAYEYESTLKQRDLEARALRKEQAAQRSIIYAVGGGLAVSAALLFLVVRSNRQRKHAYDKLNEQKSLLERQAVEIQHANTALSEKNEQLVTANAEKNEFLGIVAHDLKNPLASIRLTGVLIHSYRQRHDEEWLNKQVEKIEEVTDRMIGIINNLLNINAMESGSFNLAPANIDILPMALSAVQEYRPKAEAKNITIIVETLAEEQSVVLFADKSIVLGVLDNLISNAIKYSPHGKQVVVRILKKEEVIRMEVQDEGPGLSGEDMTKLFGKFARLSARPTGGEHSTGLGLSIVKKMVEAMNGKVWCESELGKGAVFIVELPKA